MSWTPNSQVSTFSDVSGPVMGRAQDRVRRNWASPMGTVYAGWNPGGSLLTCKERRHGKQVAKSEETLWTLGKES